MKHPTYMIDPPTPYEPPEVLWAFLRRLRRYDQEDPGVQAVRRQVGSYLIVPRPSTQERKENHP